LGHCDAELFAALPERFVVVGAVEGDVVAVPRRLLRVDALRRGGNHTLLIAPKHDHPVAQLSDRVVEFRNRLVRSARRDDGNGREALPIRREHVRGHPVVGARGVTVQLVLRDGVDREAEARVDDREVDAQLGQALVQQRRKKRRGLVARVGRNAPPDRAPQPLVLTLLRATAIPLGVPAPHRAQVINRARAAHVAQILEEDRDRLEPMAVAVNHGMPELRPDVRWRTLHVFLRYSALIPVSAEILRHFSTWARTNSPKASGVYAMKIAPVFSSHSLISARVPALMVSAFNRRTISGGVLAGAIRQVQPWI